MSIKISVILPAKNEEAAIVPVIQELSALGFYEVIVVNDGSTDNTASVASKAGANVITHPYSKGNGAAIKTGARAAKGDVLVFMDADGQHQPKEIEKLVNKLQTGYDLVVGARDTKGQASLGRSLANRFYNKLASFMTGHKVADLTSGFRAVNAAKFREFLYLLPNGFSYPTTSTMAFFRAGYSIAYTPIEVLQRTDDSTSHISPLKDGIRFLLIIFKIGTLYSPLKLFLPTSVFISLIGMLYYAYTFITMGRFTNMSALMFTTALVVFMVGLVSEQITALMYKDDK